MNVKNFLVRNIKNSVGWTTNRKLVVFEVDDYGAIRIESKSTRDNLIAKGVKLRDNKFDYYDALEDHDDLQALFDTLNSVKDVHGKPAVFTALSISANPDFDAIKASNFSSYQYELLTETWCKYRGYEAVPALWREGIEKRLLVPQFHGREHLNIKVLMENLRNKDRETILCFDHHSYGGITAKPFPTIDYVAAFQFYVFSENEALQEIITDGLNCFEQVFGFRAKHFAAPGAREHRCLAPVLKRAGVNYLDTDMVNKEHQGEGRYSLQYNYSGRRFGNNQRYLIRNCVYEPTPGDNIDWVGYCMKQIEIAFFWNKPAIVSSHRVNFAGHIEPGHRTQGLAELKRLLKSIVSRWPDVEFITTSDLGDAMNNS
jgi:hypothetical protein